MALNGLLIILVTIPVSNMSAKWPRFETISIAALLLGLGFGVTALASHLPGFAFSVAIWTLGEIAATSVAPAIVADLVPINLRGLYQGIFGAACFAYNWGLARKKAAFAKGEKTPTAIDLHWELNALKKSELAWIDLRRFRGAALEVHDGVAALMAADTLHDFRHQGIYTALMEVRLAAAAEARCELAMVHGSPGGQSQGNILRSGFQLAYTSVALLRGL